MKRAFPWIVSVVLLIAFVASFSELQRMRRRFGEVTRHAFHDHADVRVTVIRSAMAQEKKPIVFFGDSLVELAHLPGEICGKPVINAGIGGATLSQLTKIAGQLSGASLVILLAGSNDIGSETFKSDYSRLLNTLKPKVVAVAGTASGPTNDLILWSAEQQMVRVLSARFNDFVDGIHPSPDAYRGWRNKVVESISKECP